MSKRKQTRAVDAFPLLAKEFITNLTTSRRLDELSHGSPDRCLWRCDKGHEWEASVNARTNCLSGCKTCLHEKYKTTYLKTDYQSSIEFLFPEVAKEFVENLTRPDRSINETPKGSRDSCLWRCSKGHEWVTRVYHRTSSGRTCPFCSTWGESKFEHHIARLVSYMAETEVIVNNIVIVDSKKVFIDLYFPEWNKYVDIDPLYWHKDSLDRDLRKTDKCSSLDFYRVRDSKLPLIDGSTIVDSREDTLAYSIAVCEAVGLEIKNPVSKRKKAGLRQEVEREIHLAKSTAT